MIGNDVSHYKISEKLGEDATLVFGITEGPGKNRSFCPHASRVFAPVEMISLASGTGANLSTAMLTRSHTGF